MSETRWNKLNLYHDKRTGMDMRYEDVEKMAEVNPVVRACISMLEKGKWSKDQMYCHMVVNLCRQVEQLEKQLSNTVNPLNPVVYANGEVYEYKAPSLEVNHDRVQ